MIEAGAPGNMGSRLRPVRRSRWRRYLPGSVLAVLSALVLFMPVQAAKVGTALGLPLSAGIVLAGAIAVVAATVAAALADRSPPAYFISGGFALNAGFLLTSGRWPAAFLLALGLGSIAAWEIARLFDGVTIREQRLGIHRALRDTLDVDYDDIIAVHSTADGDAGTLILETHHGTVTAPDLPHVDQVQARVEARVHTVPVSANLDALDDAKDRISRLVQGSSA